MMIDKLRQALINLNKEDQELLLQDVHEASITGRLVEHLAYTFSDFDYYIDTQYNKRILDNEVVKKQMDILFEKLPADRWPITWDKNQKTVRKELLPDIIFHDRQSQNHNFLVIEIKKSTNKNASDREWDFVKLSEMTSRDLNYRFGAFIELTTGKEYSSEKPFSITIFENGTIIHKE